ncbi:MAG TPA: hypothetical protein DIT43_04455 [Dehalococcoidia bacterium]|nr:hypothetical protein [Dehalococcoidia bacterium]
MQAMMSQAMGPLFQQAVGGLMKMFTPRAAQPKADAEQTEMSAEQPQTVAEEAASSPQQSQPSVQEESGTPFDAPPIEQRNRDEWEEE